MAAESFQRQSTTIDLLRHGAPLGGQRYRGYLDDPLSERGWEQLWRAVSGEIPWDGIVSSPLLRCRAFAETLADRLTIPMRVDERFKEVGFGDWEGRTKAELNAEDPEQVRRFLEDAVGRRPPNAESLEGFLSRVGTALEELIERQTGEHLLVVCHAGVIRAAMSHLLAIPPERIYRINVETAHFTRLRIDGERPPTLVFHGRERL